MPDPTIAATPDALTPPWLTGALAEHLDGAVVTDVDRTMVGTGQMGDSVRLLLSYDRPTAAPATLVAKLPATDATSRATAAAMGSYENEVSFYRELAPKLPVRAPRCYLALHDPGTHDFVLLLEDLAPAQQGDQLRGCTVDEAALAVEELPKLHAPLWADPMLATLPWLHRGDENTTAMHAALLVSLFDGFRDRYTDRLDPEVLALAERFVPRLINYLGDRSGPWTVAHNDYRLDNLLFGTSEGGPPVAVVDWQTVSHAPGISDLSYFLGAGLLPDDRSKNETEIVHEYHHGLRAAGVSLDWNELWRDYRRYTFSGLVMAIGASMLVVQTDRGDEMFMAMANRHGRHALDLDAESLIA